RPFRCARAPVDSGRATAERATAGLAAPTRDFQRKGAPAPGSAHSSSAHSSSAHSSSTQPPGGEASPATPLASARVGQRLLTARLTPLRTAGCLPALRSGTLGGSDALLPRLRRFSRGV